MRLPHSPRAQLLALVLLAGVLLGAGLGWRQPLNVDEERFLGVALEMLQSGDWLIPHRAGQIYPDKPPLFMWLVAVLSRITGAPQVALFLPALFAGMVTTACLYDLGRRLWGRRAGCAAALLFLSTYQTFSILRAGQIDGLLCLWSALGLYGFARHLLLGPAWRWFYLGCAAVGFGVISKGVGFLPLLMLIPYGWAVRHGWSGVTRFAPAPGAWWLGVVVVIASIGIWLVPLVLTVALQGSAAERAYLDNILLHQTADRYARAWDHREPFWYFFVEVIPKYWLPLVLALPWLVPAWRRQLAKRDGRFLVLLGWVVLVLLFFSLSTGKRKLYIYPALPALVLVAAPLVPWLLQRWFRGYPHRRKLFHGLVVLWLLTWLIKGWVDPLRAGQNSHQTLMANAARASGGAELLLVSWREGHWLFARQPIVHFGFNASDASQAVAWLQTHPHALALVPAAELAQCFQPERARSIGDTSRAAWWLVGADALTDRCRGVAELAPYRFRWLSPWPAQADPDR